MKPRAWLYIFFGVGWAFCIFAMSYKMRKDNKARAMIHRPCKCKECK